MIRVTSCLPFDPQCDPITLELANQRGTAVHKACEIWDLNKFFGGPELDMNTIAPIILPYLEGWWKFLNETGFTPTHIEREVVSDTYGYAGRLDRIGSFPKRGAALVDIKTGVYSRPDTWGIQLAAYTAAHCAMENEVASKYKRLIVQLTKEATYKIYNYDDPGDFGIFLAFLTIHKWEANNE